MIARRILQLTAIFVLGLIQLGASCVSDGYYPEDERHDDRPTEYDRPRRIRAMLILSATTSNDFAGAQPGR